MKVAFIGDSFCSSEAKHSWLEIVANNLGAEPICRGRGGISIGQAYFDLINHLDDADIYFMLYTDSRRLFNGHLYPLNTVSCLDFEQRSLGGMITHNTSIYSDANIWDAGLKYFKYIYHEPYHELIHELIIKKCDEILTQHILLNPHKRVFHFHCFPANCTSYNFTSGPCCRETLFDLITRYRINLSDNYENHMTIELNSILAECICTLLNKDSGKWFDLP